MDAHLTVISGPLVGQKIPLPKGKFLIGREPDCHCLLDDLSVSRHHCVLILDDWALRIRDLNSMNGTLVNRNRLGTWEVVLSDRDIISVGSWVARIGLGVGDASEASHGVEINRETGLLASEKTQVIHAVPQPNDQRNDHC